VGFFFPCCCFCIPIGSTRSFSRFFFKKKRKIKGKIKDKLVTRPQGLIILPKEGGVEGGMVRRKKTQNPTKNPYVNRAGNISLQN